MSHSDPPTNRINSSPSDTTARPDDAKSPPPTAHPAKATLATPALRRRAVTYILTLVSLMAVLYALAYHSWERTSLGGRLLVTYLRAVAQVSAATLRLLGEQISLSDTTVSGAFSYVVVVDCAALDVQALFAAAVLAFPASWRKRLMGLVGGVAAIFVVNITRLVVLYYAGARSLDLFNTLHEEVFALVIVALVCGLFLAWARWATLQSKEEAVRS